MWELEESGVTWPRGVSGLAGSGSPLEGAQRCSQAQTHARAAGAFRGAFLSLRSAPGSRHVRSLPEAPASRTRFLGRARSQSPPPTSSSTSSSAAATAHLLPPPPQPPSPPLSSSVLAFCRLSGKRRSSEIQSPLALCAVLLPPLAPEMDLGSWASIRRNGGGLSAP